MATVRKSPWPALGAVVGPVLFTLGWFVLGFISPGYTMWGTRVAPYSATFAIMPLTFVSV